VNLIVLLCAVLPARKAAHLDPVEAFPRKKTHDLYRERVNTMNVFSKAVVAMAVGCLMSQMLGCASSSLVERWYDPSFKAPPLNKMLIIAARKDATKRRIWEDAFTVELAKHGVAATSSYGLFPDAPPDTNQVMATVQANGFDGVLVILKLPTETNPYYVKGYASMEPEGAYSGPYWQRYWNTYLLVEHPGYIDSQKVAFRAIDVTTTGNGGRMIWSAKSRTSDPDSVTDVQRGIAGLVVSELGSRNIITSKK
jgi:hypothetical protein